MAKNDKGKSVLHTQGGELGPKSPPQGSVQIVQGNTPVLNIQLLASINKNLMELGKKLDELIEIAKNG